LLDSDRRESYLRSKRCTKRA